MSFLFVILFNSYFSAEQRVFDLCQKNKFELSQCKYHLDNIENNKKSMHHK